LKKINHIQVIIKDKLRDVAGEAVRVDAEKYLSIDTGKVKTAKVYSVQLDLNEEQVESFAVNGLKDAILHDVYINKLYTSDRYQSHIIISKLPGVTDDVGVSAQKTLADFFNLIIDHGEQWIFSQDIYYFENKLSDKQILEIAEELLGNPLINHFEIGGFNGTIKYIPEVHLNTTVETNEISLDVTDDTLLKLSKKMLLALDLKEMKAIQNHYSTENIIKKRQSAGMSRQPTDCEMEILGQTWSEHCQHKEFSAEIAYKDLDSKEEKTIDSLFKTYIKGSTELIKERFDKKGKKWLLKIFSDNAGVVRVDENRVFTWKVETHNSPSALDPYGGALTGIVGVNRDPMGTGIGGGRLLFNTDVLCFGSPYYEGRLLEGQLHPRRIMTGVVKGIEDGGNKSGIPTINGSVVFDDRYAGKPLVFCGTGAIMPAKINGMDSWGKPIDSGDIIVMAGGRVGKDGIHGATFSSLEIDEHSPRSAVQIGSPITQKNLSDFMQKAVAEELIKSSTDNGAGGLSSSIGELATISNGAQVELANVPLKYSGLQPWEIFVSESQERMTFVVEPEKIEQIFNLAAEFEVELSEIGSFTSNGYLDILYDNKRVAYLDLDFLHNGTPKKHLIAEWRAPKLTEPELAEISNFNEILSKLAGSLNICSRESIIRRYDHEVKGRSIIKPLMGDEGNAPQDAGVIRLDFDSYLGLAVSNGILPRYGDINAYEMSAGSFDEAVRSIISIGGKLPDPDGEDDVFWTVNDNFCVPDSVYDEKGNPDGKYKMAQLVQMNEALYDMSTFFNIPMTSGKDSMKNDFIKEGVKISVPPTILYSMVAKLPDIRRVVTAEFKQSSDLIYLVGKTYDELGGSEFYKLFGELGANVPKVRKKDAKRIYKKMMKAHDETLLVSSHDVSDGGLAVALMESAFDGDLGVDINIENSELGVNAELFSESHSRFVVSVDPDRKDEFEKIMGDDCRILGKATENKRIKISVNGDMVIDENTDKLMEVWRNGLKF